MTVYPWRLSSVRYALPAASIAGFLTALNTAITAESLWWGVNYVDLTTDRQIEIKRINSPIGEFATSRALIFGTPSAGVVNAAALDGDTNTGALFQYLCVDANTGAGGPPTSYKSGDPYNGATGSTKGFNCMASAPVASSELSFAESEIGFWWSVSSGNPASAVSSYAGGFGYLWDHLGSPGWASLTPRSLIPVAYPANVTPAGFHIPGLQTKTATNTPRMIGVKTGLSTVWELGRMADVPGATNGFDGSAHYRSDGGLLLPVTLCGRVRGSGAGGLDGSFMGTLRQHKYGPSGTDRDVTADTIFTGGSTSSVGAGIYLDQIA